MSEARGVMVLMGYPQSLIQYGADQVEYKDAPVKCKSRLILLQSELMQILMLEQDLASF
jgi:hypothetical protein